MSRFVFYRNGVVVARSEEFTRTAWFTISEDLQDIYFRGILITSLEDFYQAIYNSNHVEVDYSSTYDDDIHLFTLSSSSFVEVDGVYAVHIFINDGECDSYPWDLVDSPSTIADKLIIINNIKQDIKSALTEQGLSPTDSLSTYPSLVSGIKTGRTMYIGTAAPSSSVGDVGDIYLVVE